jgi:CheY-like chemotaxis protein
MSDSKKILVVDDDPDVIEQVSAVLRAEGYDVVAAAGEQEARELLLSVAPDAVILDLMMEHQDSGFVLAYTIKKLYPDTPVLLLTSALAVTGMSFAPSSAEARSWVKTEGVLDKPVRPEQLRQELRKLLAPTAADKPRH